MIVNKKGLSSVVATVLLISVTIATVVLLTAFLFPFLQGVWSRGTECYDYLDYYSFDDEAGFNCYEFISGPNTYRYALTVSAESSNKELDKEIKGIDLAFTKEGETISKTVEGGSLSQGDLIMMSGEATYKIPKNGESFSYVFSSSTEFDSVSIYPVLKSGRKCDKTDTAYVRNTVCQNEIP